MNWSTAERRELLGTLDTVRQAFVTGYRALLCLVMLAVLVVVYYAVTRRPWGDGNQGEWFYFSIAVLFVLGWSVVKFISLGLRQRKRSGQSVLEEREVARRAWRLSLEAASLVTGKELGSFEFAQTIGLPLEPPVSDTLPADALPDDSALEQLRAHVESGVDLDVACRLIQPAYANWTAAQQFAYRTHVAPHAGNGTLSATVH